MRTQASASSSGSAACGGSCPPSSPTSSWPPTARPCWESHRREIVVLFFDLRGFTAFAQTSEPEEVMSVLARVPPPLLGRLVHVYDGTLERFTGETG